MDLRRPTIPFGGTDRISPEGGHDHGDSDALCNPKSQIPNLNCRWRRWRLEWPRRIIRVQPAACEEAADNEEQCKSVKARAQEDAEQKQQQTVENIEHDADDERGARSLPGVISEEREDA